jgi:hypothetical protein
MEAHEIKTQQQSCQRAEKGTFYIFGSLFICPEKRENTESTKRDLMCK